jgi:hypothetical protein
MTLGVSRRDQNPDLQLKIEGPGERAGRKDLPRKAFRRRPGRGLNFSECSMGFGQAIRIGAPYAPMTAWVAVVPNRAQIAESSEAQHSPAEAIQRADNAVAADCPGMFIRKAAFSTP